MLDGMYIRGSSQLPSFSDPSARLISSAKTEAARLVPKQARAGSGLRGESGREISGVKQM